MFISEFKNFVKIFESERYLNVGEDMAEVMLNMIFSIQFIVITNIKHLASQDVWNDLFGKHGFLISFWQTPLHRAAYWGYKESAEVLLKYGADKTLENVWNLQIVGKRVWEWIFHVRVNHWGTCERKWCVQKQQTFSFWVCDDDVFLGTLDDLPFLL